MANVGINYISTAWGKLISVKHLLVKVEVHLQKLTTFSSADSFLNLEKGLTHSPVSYHTMGKKKELQCSRRTVYMREKIALDSGRTFLTIQAACGIEEPVK